MDDVLIRSFGTKGGNDDMLPVTPPVYARRQDILFVAATPRNFTSLSTWLNETAFYNRYGKPMSVNATLKYIAGRESAHIISATNDDRLDVGILLTPEAQMNTLTVHEFEDQNPWRQFVIDAGMWFLSVRDSDNNSIFRHHIPIPKYGNEDSFRLLKKKSAFKSGP